MTDKAAPRWRKVLTRPEDRLFWGVFGASALVAALTMIAIRLIPATPPPVRSGQMLPRMRGPRGPVSTGDLLRSMGIGSLTWYLSILSAPLFIWMSRRLPFDRRRWHISLAVHLAVIAGLVGLTGIIQYRLSYGGAAGAPPMMEFLRASFLTGSLPFLTVAAAAQALEARMRARDRELDAVRVRGQLAEARLESLTAQLQPHFLFNTLQAISTLITRDPPAAEKMLASLSDLLREVLRRGDRREITLDEELRILDSYLDISRRRFGDRLTIAITVDQNARRALVPFFILQPLVENALHHGVGSRAGPASVQITADRIGDQLSLTVSDDGAGSDSSEIRPGIGLTNTKARLEELYGERHALDIMPGPGGGFCVQLSLPYREAAATE